ALPPERSRRQIATLERELWTPAGLREGSGSRRILTEWSAHFLTARLRAHGRSAAAQDEARAWLSRFARIIDRHAAGGVPTAFTAAGDAATDDAPLHYDGAPISTVASAELLKFWIEDLDHDRQPAGGTDALEVPFGAAGDDDA